MSLGEVKELGKWPFCPETLTPAVPEHMLSLVIGGISECLQAPVVLMECKPCPIRPGQCIPNFIYPTYTSAQGMQGSLRTYRCPSFCKVFQKSFKNSEKICSQDSTCHNHVAMRNGNKSKGNFPEKCDQDLNICMEYISYLGHNLAVCISGKFVQPGEGKIVDEELHNYAGVIPENEIEHLKSLIRQQDCQRDIGQFKVHFKEEVAHLAEMVQNYFDTVREQNEWICREQIAQALYSLPNKLDDFSFELQEVLHVLQVTLSVEYLALFFADISEDRVLPLTAQAGLSQDSVSSVHFNWRKAGIPSRDRLNLQEWLGKNSNKPNFPKIFIEKGVQGPGKESLQNASHIIPYGREFRGVLLIGPWKQEMSPQAVSRGKNFIQSIGHLLVANAISKRAMATSLQYNRRRDFIQAMTAHNIKHALHTFYNSLSKLRHYSTKSIQLPSIISACDRMEELVRTMSKYVDISMSAPGTAVLPGLSKYEMEIEKINLAVLLYNCAGGLEDRARDKQVSLCINESIDNLPLIRGDRYMLQLLFSNIIDNAIKYSRVSKEVRIYAERNDKKYIAIIIEDFGFGIQKADLYKIFEEEYRIVDVASKKVQSPGIGLGLFQALQIAKIHGGDITASSVSIARDINLVKFTVQLPK